MSETRGERFGWRLDVAVLLGAWAWLFAFHPPVGFLWAEYPRIVYTYLPLPWSLEGMRAAIEWQATVHTPGLVRPVRAIQWWLAAKALGCSPLAYFVAMVLALGAAIWAVVRIAWHVTGRRAAALFVGACLAVSYANAYSLLFFGFGLTAACAFGGLALHFRAEELEGRARAARQALGFLLLLAAGLAHETFLALALVPVAHAVIVRRRRAAVARALVFVAVLPCYVLVGRLMGRVYGTGVLTIAPGTLAWSYPWDVLVEIAARGGFSVLSGGLPFDTLRALPWVPAFSRLREFALTPAGLATAAVVVAPCLLLAAAALGAGAGDGTARRRVLFGLAWLAFGSLPLLFPAASPIRTPAAAPEAFHLTGALPALFLVWWEALGVRGRRGLALVVVAVGLWFGIHGAARWVLFHRDLPRMARSVHALETVLADADARGEEARVLFFPIQIGAHYGFIPTIQPLYPTVARRACAIGDRVPGCLVEPTWIWSALGPPPPLPPACHTADGVRVGPLTSPMRAELEGSRRILVGSGAGWATRHSAERARGQRLISGCPLAGVEPVRHGAGVYWLYRAAGGPNVRWYRFALEPRPAVVPVSPCGEGT